MNRPLVLHEFEDMNELVTNTYRPKFYANHREKQPAINSILLKREWEALDSEVMSSYRIRLNGVADIRNAGLVTETSLAEMLSSWKVGTERRRPNVTMDGRTRVDEDRSERRTYSVPLPIIATSYQFGMRELMASRAVGADLDMYEAAEAAQAVAEEQERMLFNGNSDIVVQGSQIYGYTNHPDRLSDTASNFGGGDFGTLGNAHDTFVGAISSMAANRYYGPFMVYIANTQYHELLDRYEDGSGQNELQSILELPQITAIKPNDILSAGEVVMVQLDRRTVDLRTAMGLENRQWEHPAGDAVFFKVMAAEVHRLKTDSRGNLGVCHITSA